MFKEQFERVLPASSVANLYPFNYSGKTDPKGFFIGRDKYGTNILVDFDRRAEDKTNANCLILGNSGQGKSFLLKLILTNLRESGKRIISLDPEAEYEELTKALGGCYIDFMSGEFIINPLEPKSFGRLSLHPIRADSLREILVFGSRAGLVKKTRFGFVAEPAPISRRWFAGDFSFRLAGGAGGNCFSRNLRLIPARSKTINKTFPPTIKPLITTA